MENPCQTVKSTSIGTLYVSNNVSPRLYTSGTCGTCNAAKSGRGRTTEFSAGPPYIPRKVKEEDLKWVTKSFQNDRTQDRKGLRKTEKT